MRKKSNVIFDSYVPMSSKYNNIQRKRSLRPQPDHLNNSYVSGSYPDSLQRFQEQIQKSLFLHNASKAHNKRRAYTQMVDDQQQQIPQHLSNLQGQIAQLKGQFLNYKQQTKFEDKLDQLMIQMNRSKDIERELMRQRQGMQHPYSNQNMYYPQQYPPQAYPQRHFNDTRKDADNSRTKRSKTDSLFDSTYPQKPVNRIRSKARRVLRKYLIAVAFPFLLKGEAKKLAQRRRANMRTFYLQKFNSQMVNLKNWLVNGLSFSLPVILQKQKLNLQFWKDKRQQFHMQKQRLLLRIVQIGLNKMKQQCTPQKVSLFAQIIHNLCSKGSFPMSRFWSAQQMKFLCVSETLGCIRAEQTLQKFMITLVVFIKVLVFNLLLQPYKFDSTNFPRNKQPLSTIMHIIASIYYRLAGTVMQQYLDQQRPSYYNLGNWLKMKEQFIVECCEPLVFKAEYPDDDQWITGMFGKELLLLTESSQWQKLLGLVRGIVDYLHLEMKKRRKDVVRNQKFKLYS